MQGETEKEKDNTNCVFVSSVGLVWWCRVGSGSWGQLRPGQPRLGRMEIIKKRREARSAAWAGRPGWQCWQCGQSLERFIHHSPPLLRQCSGQSPPWGPPPPITTNLQLPSSILNQHRSNLHYHQEPTIEDVSTKHKSAAPLIYRKFHSISTLFNEDFLSSWNFAIEARPTLYSYQFIMLQSGMA